MAFRRQVVCRSQHPAGISSDFVDISGDDLNLGLGVVFSYVQSHNVQWLFGLHSDLMSQYPVLPIAGVRWQFADQWTLSLIAPKPRVEYRPMDDLTLFAGGEFLGGAFRVSEKLGIENGNPALNNARLDYREFRVGGGASYRFTDWLSATVDGGWAIDRRFTYHKQDVLLNGDGAPYVQVGLSGSF